MCGEKREIVAQPEVKEGSPPRVRGKDLLDAAQQAYPGITPACAGKREGYHNGLVCGRDHPRVCGEKYWITGSALIVVGSPPRVRGKVNVSGGVLSYRGDHPRVCGEKKTSIFAPLCRLGSPPRVRGKAAPHILAEKPKRITPACAGKRN